MEKILYLDGTTGHISVVVSTELTYFNGEWCIDVDGRHFEWHANMWMEK